jgi:hypothetical protein
MLLISAISFTGWASPGRTHPNALEYGDDRFHVRRIRFPEHFKPALPLCRSVRQDRSFSFMQPPARLKAS